MLRGRRLDRRSQSWRRAWCFSWCDSACRAGAGGRQTSDRPGHRPLHDEAEETLGGQSLIGYGIVGWFRLVEVGLDG